MPYIKHENRVDIHHGCMPNTSGELNYTITKVIRDYLTCHKESYQTMNDILGALEGAKIEFYRRVIIPYEEKKLKENGDVY